MNVLEELRNKVLHVVEKNRALQDQINKLTKENEELKQHKKQLEASLMKENESLLKEKDKVKGSIETLLESISSLEKINQ